jgi:hypothetical protein
VNDSDKESDKNYHFYSKDDNGFIKICLALSRYIRIFDFRDHSITMVEIWSYNSVYQLVTPDLPE